MDEAPNRGECWQASLDTHPSSKSGVVVFCPAGAASGEPGLDEPHGLFLGVDAAEVVALDRVYFSLDGIPIPYARDET